MDGRDPFDFNTLSSGYAAVLDIVVDLIIRKYVIIRICQQLYFSDTLFS